MLETLDAVIERLVAHYQPERILLFGSRATQGARSDSDIDLLIVKDTEVPPRERRAEVERLLADRALPLDICVYTPTELHRLFRLGSPFIEEVLDTARVVYMRKATEAWMREVAEEARMARLLTEGRFFRGACLHSQQTVEKGLKALILERGERPPRTHDVVELFNRVGALGYRFAMSIDDLVFLNSVYRGRYPTDEGLLPHGEPTEGEAQQAVQTAERFEAEARGVLNEDAGR
jgi:HEPN domain-containing protein/predicted nucleotidyltransferase